MKEQEEEKADTWVWVVQPVKMGTTSSCALSATVAPDQAPSGVHTHRPCRTAHRARALKGPAARPAHRPRD